jgi:outer membrane protein TolC
MKRDLKKLASIGALACLVGFATTAPAASEKAVPLTLADAIRRAIACNGRIEALQSAVRVAQEQKHAATDITDPELGISRGRNISDDLRYRSSSRNITSDSVTTDDKIKYTQNTESQSSLTTGSERDYGDGWKFNARLFVPNPWIIGPRIDAAKAATQAARADIQTAEWMVTCEVRRLFSEINYRSRDLVLAEEIVRLDSLVLKVVQSRTAQGAATVSETMSAARQHLKVQSERDLARQRLKVAQRGLSALLNIPTSALLIDTNMPACLPSQYPPFSMDLAERVALRSRGDIVALHWRVLAAHAKYRESRNVRNPWIKEINASYRASSDQSFGADTTTGSGSESSTTQSGLVLGQGTSRSSEYGVVERSNHRDGEEWWVGVALDIPIFSLGKNHADKVLLAQYELACANEREGLQLVGREIRDALDELEESRLQLVSYENDVAPLISDMRRTLVILKSTPDIMPDHVAGTELQLLESVRLELGIGWRCTLARISLESALGAPLSETLRSL